MTEPAQHRSRWMPFLGGCGSGCLVGLIVGLACGAAAYWAWTLEKQDAALRPLANLNVPDRQLTLDETRPFIEKLAREYLASKGNVGLAIAVLDGDESRVFGFGRVALASDRIPDGDTLFEIASVGKTFTSTLLAEMHLRGELSWDDAVESFLPVDVKVPRVGGRKITLLDLATQTSGLPSLPPNFQSKYPLNPYADYTVPQMYAGLGQIELPRAPGMEYEYSNLGFGLLGHALELQGGTRFEELVVKRLCDPLEMNSTRMTLDDALKSRLAIPHDGGKPVQVWEDTTMPGAGSFLSTANDMLCYVRAHGRTEADANDTLARAMRETVHKHRRADTPQRAMGLGWHIDPENALDIIWHNGGAGGSCSYVAFLRDRQVGVVVLSYSSSPVDELGYKVLYLLAQH